MGADIGGIYDWDLSTVPQMQLDGVSRPMPQGKVLGGGSILNAMCWNRGGQDDYNAWKYLGNPGWGWDGILPYFMKVIQRTIDYALTGTDISILQSETYTPVDSEEIAKEYQINYNPSVHGYSGPVHVGYPKYFYPQSSRSPIAFTSSLTDCSLVNFFQALNYLGVPTEYDQAEGTIAGAAFVPTDLHPDNQTRSDARRSYYDPYASRANLHVVTGRHVTQLLIQGVSENSAAHNPNTGGNTDGDGGATGMGLGFGPGASPPSGSITVGPAATATPGSRRVKKDAPFLRILGVEVTETLNVTDRICTADLGSLLLMPLHHVKQCTLHGRSLSLRGRYTPCSFWSCQALDPPHCWSSSISQ